MKLLGKHGRAFTGAIAAALRLLPGRRRPGVDGAASAIAGLRAVSMASGLAIGLLGFLNGATEPNAGGRANQIQDTMGVSDALFSLGWAGWPVGMWLASMVGGWLLERIGARTLLLVGAICYWAAFAFVGQVTDPSDLFQVMLLVGVGNGFFDVGYYRIAPWFERQKQRLEGAAAGFVNQILNGLFSMGSVVAAGIVWLAAGFDVSLAWHLATVGVVALAVTVGWAVWKLPNLKGTDEEVYDLEVSTGRHREGLTERLRSAPWELRRAGIVGFCAALPIGIGYVWASVYLARLGADEWVAPLGLVSFTAVEMLVRLSVGWLSRHIAFLRNPVRLTRIGGAVALAGLALVVVPGRIDLAVLGFGLLGGGLAPVGAFVQSAAPRIWERHKGLASGLVTRYVYLALVAGPVFIGPVSSLLGSAETATPLRIALGCTAVLPLTVILMARNVGKARIEEAVT